jgi:UDP-N-acetylmuramyl pentapeptide phosphotransferase/UDP-N-acetylglucosamine-1-phosphate transferase
LTLIGLGLAAALAAFLLPRWAADMVRTGLSERNYRGRELAAPLGAALISVALIALVPLALLDDRADLDLLDPELRRWIVYVLGVALLGVVDDLLGRRETAEAPRGWRAHAAAVARGELSTGAIKATGALGLAAFAVSGRGRESLDYVADVGVLLLATNAFNLLDLRPGRVEKALGAVLAGLCLGSWTALPLESMGIFIGPLAVGAALTLRERAMLGDSGSNLAGAVAGVALLQTLDPTGAKIALGALALFTVYAEFRSVSALIDRIPPLRRLDSLGRAD